jgi:3-isopropylmalate dehydrogenase
VAEAQRIAVIAGDGIGPEVTEVGLRALAWARDAHGLPLDIWELPLGAERWLREGVGLPPTLLDEIRTTCSAVLLGALGDARIPGHEHAREILFGLRFGLDLYANIRPMRALSPRLIPLRGVEHVDICVFRENTEGLYAGIGGQLRRGTAHEVAVEEDVNTRLGVERIVRAAFDFARRERRKLCLSDKSNALRHAHELWQRVYAEVRGEYPDVVCEHLYIDALCYELVRDPARFSVIVCCNLFGDIVSDLVAGLGGGLGVAPSASVHLGSDVPVPALFEPVHGSAPQLVGKNLANPVAMLRTVGMLFDWLGRADLGASVERAAQEAVEAHECTPDVGGTLGTTAAGEAVLRRLR